MRHPRLRAAAAILGLPMAASASGQVPSTGGASAQSTYDTGREPTLVCKATREEASATYNFMGYYDGSPLHLSAGKAQLTIRPAGTSSAGLTQHLTYETGDDGIIKISALSPPHSVAPGARITATFTQDDVRIPLATSRLSSDTTNYTAIAAAAIDTSKAAGVTFAENGRVFSRIDAPRSGHDLFSTMHRDEPAFVGLTRADAAARGCTTYVASSRVPCFLTTATVDCIGLADDCWELQTLRRFRDTVLVRSREGRALVERYYASAPAIVAAVNARSDASAVWLRTYWTGIVPSAIAAHLGCNRLALKFYGRMVGSLLATLGPAVTIG